MPSLFPYFCTWVLHLFKQPHWSQHEDYYTEVLFILSRDSRKLWICLARWSPFCLCHFHLLLTKPSCQNIQRRNVSCLDQFLAALVSTGLCEICMWQVKVTPAGAELLVYLLVAASCPQPHGQPPTLGDPSTELGHPLPPLCRWICCSSSRGLDSLPSQHEGKHRKQMQQLRGFWGEKMPTILLPPSPQLRLAPYPLANKVATISPSFWEAQSLVPVFLATPGQRQSWLGWV